MQAHRKQISAIKLTMNMAKHGAKGLNIFRSHRKNSYSTVSVSFFGLPPVQSSRDTRKNSGCLLKVSEGSSQCPVQLGKYFRQDKTAADAGLSPQLKLPNTGKWK